MKLLVHPEQATTSGGPGKALADQLNAHPPIEGGILHLLLPADQPLLPAFNQYCFTWNSMLYECSNRIRYNIKVCKIKQ